MLGSPGCWRQRHYPRTHPQSHTNLSECNSYALNSGNKIVTLFGAESSQEAVHKWQEFLGSRGYRQEDIWSDQSLYFRWGERNKVEPEGVFQSKERHYFIRRGSWGHFFFLAKQRFLSLPQKTQKESWRQPSLTAVYVLTYRHIHAHGCYINKHRWRLIRINHCLEVTVAFLQSRAGPYVICFLRDIWLFLVTCHFWAQTLVRKFMPNKESVPFHGLHGSSLRTDLPQGLVPKWPVPT